MSADELEPGESKRAERSWLQTVLLMAVPLAVVWAIAFLITGLLWWGATDSVDQVPPPAAPHIAPVDAAGIDLDRYTAAHPRWEP